MAVKRYNGTSWDTVAGAGTPGAAGIVTSATAPSDTSVLWADTTVTTNNALIPAGGTTGQVLSKTSSSDYAASWSTPAAGGMTVIATGTLSGAAVTLSSIPSTYNNLQLDWYGATWGTGNAQMTLRFNGLSASNYHYVTNGFMGSTSQARGGSGTEWFLSESTNDTSRTNALNHYSATFYNYASTTGMPLASCNYSFFDVGNQMASFHGTLGYNNSAAAITSLTIAVDAGYTFSGGTYVLYGVK